MISSTMTTPNSSGLVTRLSVMVANAPLVAWRRQRVEVEIRQRVARNHDERCVVEQRFGHLHGAGRAERRVFDDVRHAYAEVAAVAEVTLDFVGEVVQRGDDVFHAVPPQQVDDVLHHRFVGDGRERLGTARS